MTPEGCHWRRHEAGGTASEALFSDCGAYRYFLSRRWAPGPHLLWIMLNPSRADERADDATIARCVHRAREGGFGGLAVANLHAFRATHPRDLFSAADPDGPHNGAVLQWALRDPAADMILCAWGRHGTLRGAALSAGLSRPLHALRLNKDGSPEHPLRIGYAIRPFLWKAA